MRLGNRTFSPKLWALLVYLAVLSCMLFLGFWQLQRAELKIMMQKAAQQAAQAPAVELSLVENIDRSAVRYERVSLSGIYEHTRQLLWDNRTHKGVAGYEVIVPLNLDDGRLALVNRGWLAVGASRQQLPDVALPAVAIGVPVSVQGYLSQPSKGFASGDALQAGEPWPKRLQYFDYDAIGQALGRVVVPAVIQAQSLSIDAKTPTLLTPRPEWLVANWQPAASGPAKHYSYAFQWFAMALALSVIFVCVNCRKIPEKDPVAID